MRLHYKKTFSENILLSLWWPHKMMWVWHMCSKVRQGAFRQDTLWNIVSSVGRGYPLRAVTNTVCQKRQGNQAGRIRSEFPELYDANLQSNQGLWRKALLISSANANACFLAQDRCVLCDRYRKDQFWQPCILFEAPSHRCSQLHSPLLQMTTYAFCRSSRIKREPDQE